MPHLLAIASLYLQKNSHQDDWWQCTPLIPTLKRQMKVEVILIYKVSSRKESQRYTEKSFLVSEGQRKEKKNSLLWLFLLISLFIYLVSYLFVCYLETLRFEPQVPHMLDSYIWWHAVFSYLLFAHWDIPPAFFLFIFILKLCLAKLTKQTWNYNSSPAPVSLSYHHLMNC